VNARSGAKKALIIAYEFPPVGGIASVWRAKYVKFLPHFGWEPLVVSARDIPTNIPDRTLLAELPPQLTVVRTFSLEPTRLVRFMKRLRAGGEDLEAADKEQGKVLFSYTGLPFDLVAKIKAFFIPDEKIGWFPFALAAALRLIREHSPQVIFSGSPPFTAHLVAMACKRITGLPWVCEFIDPWVDYTHFKPLSWFNKKADLILERSIVRNADAVIGAFPGIVEGFESRYGDVEKSRYKVITYGFDPADFTEEVTLRDGFTVTWIGSAFGGRSPRGLIEAVRRLLDQGRITPADFRLSFVGTMDVGTLKAVKEAGIDEVVEMTGFVTYGESIRYMRSSHLLALQLAEGRDSRMVYTGKMFEYFGSRRPILALAGEGATKTIIEETGAGVVVEPSDVEGIADALRYYLSRYRAGDGLWVDNPRLDEFDREKQTAGLAGILADVARDLRS
jgi:glycosyltransferase involved in cell wall biosynthesis